MGEKKSRFSHAVEIPNSSSAFMFLNQFHKQIKSYVAVIAAGLKLIHVKL